MKRELRGALLCTVAFFMLLSLPVSGLVMTDQHLRPSIQSASTDWWPMFRHDPAHTGFTASVGPQTPTLAWRNNQSTYLLRSSPAIIDSRLYTIHRFATMPEYGDTFCLDTSHQGSLLWLNYTGGSDSSLAATNDSLYQKNIYGDVLALRATTGELSWTCYIGAGMWMFLSSPVIANDKVYFSCENGSFYCFDVHNAKDPRILWRNSLYGAMKSSPAIVNDTLIVGSNDGNVTCLNGSRGKRLWSFHTNDEVWSSPSILNDRVFIGSNDGTLYCLPLKDPNGDGIITYAEIHWGYHTNGPVHSSPAVAYGNVFFGSDDGNLYCLDASTGTLKWSFPTGGPIYSSPAVTANGLVYIGSTDMILYCINATTGAKLWSYTTNGPIYSSPAVADGKVYITADRDGIYCFDDNRPPYAPIDPSPADSENNVKLHVNLSWTGGDPDTGNSVTYDVYVGQTGHITKVSSNQTSASFNPESLDCLTTYEWRIIAWDNHGARNESPIWSFTTKADTFPPTITLITPKEGYLYLRGKELGKRLFSHTTFILGPITMVLNVSDNESGIRTVEFYLDDILLSNITNEPFSYCWNQSSFSLKTHTLKIVSHDGAGHQASREISLKKLF
jgi:outer membrane protein assembly factor BamB